jgi:hypothetical protein
VAVKVGLHVESMAQSRTITVQNALPLEKDNENY